MVHWEPPRRVEKDIGKMIWAGSAHTSSDWWPTQAIRWSSSMAIHGHPWPTWIRSGHFFLRSQKKIVPKPRCWSSVVSPLISHRVRFAVRWASKPFSQVFDGRLSWRLVFDASFCNLSGDGKVKICKNPIKMCYTLLNIPVLSVLSFLKDTLW